MSLYYRGLLLKTIVVTCLFILAPFSIAWANPEPEQNTAPASEQPIALNQPNAPDAEIVRWAQQVAVLPYQYNYKNYNENLNHAALYFSRTGWDAFIATLQGSGMLTDMAKNQVSVSARISGQTTLLKKGIVNGRFAWKISIPMYLYYHSGGISRQRSMVAILTIMRAPPNESPHGILITEYQTMTQAVVSNEPIKTRLEQFFAGLHLH